MSSTSEGEAMGDVIIIGPWWLSMFEINPITLFVVTVRPWKDKVPAWVRGHLGEWHGNEAEMRALFEQKQRELAEAVALQAMGLAE